MNKTCHTANNPDSSPISSFNSSKHIRKFSREVDNNEDICPTTPTKEMYQRDYMSLNAPIGEERKASPLRQSFSRAHEGTLAALSGVDVPISSNAGTPGGEGRVSPPSSPMGFAGLRRRSVNVSGERPSLGGITMMGEAL